MGAAAARLSHLGVRGEREGAPGRAALSQSRSRAASLVACTLLGISSPYPAYAQVTTDEAVEATSVELVVVGEPRELTTLQASLGRIAPHGASLQWFLTSRLTSTEVLRVPNASTVARCFIDLSALPKARLYFADRTAQRFLIRDVTLDAGLDEMSKETLAQIIETSLDALLDQSAALLTREQLRRELSPSEPVSAAPSAAPPPAAPPVAPPRYRLDWQLFYAAEGFADSPPIAHGPGLGASFGPARDLRFDVWGTAQFQWPQSFQTRLIGLQLQTLPLRAGVGAQTTLSSSLRLGVRLGVGVDFVHLTPRAGTSGDALLTSARWTAVSTETALLDLQLRLNRSTALMLSPFLDLDIEPRHYDASINGERRIALEPAAVRPGLALAAVSAF